MATPMIDPPNLELLIKLMKMTTSATDGEALNAIRAANVALKKSGGDWEVLLRGKLAPIDPFASLPEPARAAPKPTPQPSQTYNHYTPRPRPTIYFGQTAKEAKEIGRMISLVEFATMTTFTTNQINDIVSRWTKNKKLDSHDYNLLKQTHNAIKSGRTP